MRMYEVCAKCGHVGRNYYTEKIFPVFAENGKEAALKARSIPRVKHHHSDAIRYVNQIGEERFNELIRINNQDPYFSCHNIQEQREIETIVFLEERKDNIKKEEHSKRAVYIGKQTIRNPKKFMQHYVTEERYAI